MHDATVPPSPGRLANARLAGLRPRSRWLGYGLVLSAIACSLETRLPEIVVTWLAAALANAMAGGPLPPWHSIVVASTSVAAVGVMAAVISTVMVGGWGPISGSERNRLGVVRWRLPVLSMFALVTMMVFVFLNVLGSVVAAGARSADASPHALGALWHNWLVRTTWILASGATVAGVVETVAMRRSLWSALHRSVSEARREQRESGRR